jgi:nickel-dependent lactate racemase
MTKENNITLKYGDTEIEFNIDENNIISTLLTNRIEPLKEPSNRLEQLLEKPINSPSLEQLIQKKKAQKILIIVNDVTRPTPYEVLLPPLLKKLEV